MSSQRGNAQRTRPPKYKNTSAYKNNLHDTSNKTKLINSIHVSHVCTRCKEIIEWKIKYKKYKPLTQPRTCVKCGLKNVKQAYHVMCNDCGSKLGVCTKCCQSKEVVIADSVDKEQQCKLDEEMKNLLKTLPERKRRTFMRYLTKNKKTGEEDTVINEADERSDLLAKLKQLKVEEDEEDDDFSDSDEFDE